jgi:cytochrome c peroxidase
MRMREIASWMMIVGLLASGACETRAARSDHDHDHELVAVDAGARTDGFDWRLPTGFPRPVVPADNPLSAEKVELGRHIFYDERLSENETFACSTCHQQAFAFADQRGVGLGSTGELHTRGSMSLANVAYSPTLTWANPLMTELERQAQVPIFGDAPIELGMMSIEEVEGRFRADAMYRQRFASAFPDDAEPVTMTNLLRALASFERTLISGNSAYDRYLNAGDERALSDSAKRGMRLVTTNEDHRFECNHCHGGFNFSDHVVWDGLQQDVESPPYHQTGLYDLDGKGAYPEPNTGVYNTSLRPEDMGKFKAPTLRNIALTAPYMHDGSIATLEGVLEHYSHGGRSPNASRTDPLLKPFAITAQEKADIVAFLQSLTDEEFITNPDLSDPERSEE